MSLVYCIDLDDQVASMSMYVSCVSCPLGDPCLSLYTLEGQGYKENIVFGTITISSTTCNLTVHASILWAGPPLMVRPMSCLEDTGGRTPTASFLTVLAFILQSEFQYRKACI